MKPFDLEAAKNGAAVCTRDGRDARIICFDRKLDCNSVERQIIALIERDYKEILEIFTKDGKCRSIGDSGSDLFMKSVKKEGWINIYPGVYKSRLACSSDVYNSKEYAKSVAADGEICVRIEWEE